MRKGTPLNGIIMRTQRIRHEAGRKGDGTPVPTIQGNWVREPPMKSGIRKRR